MLIEEVFYNLLKWFGIYKPEFFIKSIHGLKQKGLIRQKKEIIVYQNEIEETLRLKTHRHNSWGRLISR